LQNDDDPLADKVDKVMRQTIYRSANIHAFVTQPATIVQNLVVICFQNWRQNHNLDNSGFGEGFLLKNDIPGIFVNCISNAWWQYDDLQQALAVVAAAAAPFERRITYGSSMGGYAALRFADIIGATMVISASPQFSPRQEVVSLEIRYAQAIRGVIFKYESSLSRFKDIARFLLYDPFLKIDKEQACRYTEYGNVTLVPIPASGHPCLSLLLDQKRLSAVIKLMMSGSFDINRFKIEQRGLRRKTYRYWDQLSYRLAERRKLIKASQVAEKAADQFLDHKDKALSLALRWALYAGDHVRAGMITTRISAGYPEAVQLWIKADEHRRRVLAQ
jgi:hypothetical protein